jgi:hypothetical protein
MPFPTEFGDTEVPLLHKAWFFNRNCGCGFSLYSSMRGDFCRGMHRDIIFVLIIVNILNEFSFN